MQSFSSRRQLPPHHFLPITVRGGDGDGLWQAAIAAAIAGHHDAGLEDFS
jgi:hypothetical protein